MTESTSAPKRLTRSTTDSWLAGVCGGIAAYLGVDVTLVRLATVVLALVGLPGVIIAYIAGWILMPKDVPLPPTDDVATTPPPFA